ncbi:MAG: hypothetical protein WAK82_26665 [Streptosporangiaceae bacterium]
MSAGAVPPPDEVRYAEDLVPGETARLGTYRLSRAELIAFARQWDPAVLHVDEAAGHRPHRRRAHRPRRLLTWPGPRPGGQGRLARR